jgi:hypothetical protein
MTFEVRQATFSYQYELLFVSEYLVYEDYTVIRTQKYPYLPLKRRPLSRLNKDVNTWLPLHSQPNNTGPAESEKVVVTRKSPRD